MAKAEKKEVKETKVVPPSLPGGMSAKDLSIEKRTELFNAAFQEFQKMGAETFGLKVGCQMAYLPQATVPRMVVIDLLNKNEETKQPTQPAKV